MLGNCHYLPDFDHTHHASRIGRAVQPGSAPGAMLSALRTAWETWRDGLAAHRQYEQLRSRGRSARGARRRLQPLAGGA